MLEVIVIVFEGPKRNVESDRYIGLQDCALGEDLEYCHVLSI